MVKRSYSSLKKQSLHRGDTDDLSSYEIDGLKSIMRMANDLVEMEDDIIELLNRLKEQV